MPTTLKTRESWIRDRIFEITAALRSNAIEGVTVDESWSAELNWLTVELNKINEAKIAVGVVVAAEGIQEGAAVYIGADRRAHTRFPSAAVTPELARQIKQAADDVKKSVGVNRMQRQVREFMEKMDQVRGEYPEMRDHMLRFRLIWEESHELCEAILAEDFPQAIDGMCDLLYVVFGTAEAFGVNLQTYFDEVHRTNMLKEKDVKDRWGKVIKPEGWKPPHIKELLAQETAEKAAEMAQRLDKAAHEEVIKFAQRTTTRNADTRQAVNVQASDGGGARKHAGPMD